ncbi:type IV pilus modification protein PilV [Massilia violaceinigra]|uniref:Type IV pilus modification protein PilV n=1 Tax=Massilia violaceinigra TaxID=2045208 RepID=A0ABY4A883_9BURK|nr:type IV pilus modification protein PilV [Massilia violaceinigra]UOD29771.1 type IV pilus modification protein PilV [Massilia violaceinigra]
MRRQQGFSLIEILITMLLMSVGLLGIAGIILTNLKNNQSSQARGQATILVNDIVDRMRANRTTAETVDADGNSPYTLAIGGEPPAGNGVVATDLTQWRAALKQSIPKGDGSVTYKADTRKFTIVLQWDDSRVKADATTYGPTAQTITVETQL